MGNEAAAILRHFGFLAAAHAAEEASVTFHPRIKQAWREYYQSGGDVFLHTITHPPYGGETFKAPRVLNNRRSMA